MLVIEARLAVENGGVIGRKVGRRRVFREVGQKADGGGVDLKVLIARGLSMGDEMHQRNVACTSLLLRELAPKLAKTSDPAGDLAGILSFIGGNDQFFLNVAMAMGKSIMDPVNGIEHSSVVTAMARNGTEFGIRVSGTGERWFTAPVEMPRGLYFPGFSADDANPELVGLFTPAAQVVRSARAGARAERWPRSRS